MESSALNRLDRNNRTFSKPVLRRRQRRKCVSCEAKEKKSNERHRSRKLLTKPAIFSLTSGGRRKKPDETKSAKWMANNSFAKTSEKENPADYGCRASCWISWKIAVLILNAGRLSSINKTPVTSVAGQRKKKWRGEFPSTGPTSRVPNFDATLARISCALYSAILLKLYLWEMYLSVLCLMRPA